MQSAQILHGVSYKMGFPRDSEEAPVWVFLIVSGRHFVERLHQLNLMK